MGEFGFEPLVDPGRGNALDSDLGHQESAASMLASGKDRDPPSPSV